MLAAILVPILERQYFLNLKQKPKLFCEILIYLFTKLKCFITMLFYKSINILLITSTIRDNNNYDLNFSFLYFHRSYFDIWVKCTGLRILSCLKKTYMLRRVMLESS